MDRAGNVDSVGAVEVSVEHDPSGWDAYAVWRERVHGPRERARATGPVGDRPLADELPSSRRPAAAR